MQHLKTALSQLCAGQNISAQLSKDAIDEIMDGLRDDEAKILAGAFLSALATKGESVDEITGAARSLIGHGTRLQHDFSALEIVGTGGDKSESFNISTTSAFVIAAAGVKVAKHGNRAVTSKSGAADVLEALGVKIDVEPQKSLEMLENINICFLFAQKYHPSMKNVAPIRKALGVRTIFNIIGPLTNPAGADMEIMGVYAPHLVEPLAQVMQNLGIKRGMVVHGLDVMDEISLSADTKICEINGDSLKSYVFNPESVGYKKCNKEELKGGDANENAKIIRDILSGKLKGAKRDIVCLNAAAALYVANKVDNLTQGVKLAQALLDSGEAENKMLKFIEMSNK